MLTVILIWRLELNPPNCQIKITAKCTAYTVINYCVKNDHRSVIISVGLLNSKHPVPCVFNSRRQLSLAEIGRFGVSAMLPCHVWAGVVCGGEHLYTASAHGQPCDNNNVILFISP